MGHIFPPMHFMGCWWWPLAVHQPSCESFGGINNHFALALVEHWSAAQKRDLFITFSLPFHKTQHFSWLVLVGPSAGILQKGLVGAVQPSPLTFEKWLYLHCWWGYSVEQLPGAKSHPQILCLSGNSVLGHNAGLAKDLTCQLKYLQLPYYFCQDKSLVFILGCSLLYTLN